MRSQALKTLQVLDELARDSDLTQRSLSKRLGVSVSLVNLFLKRLAAKGFIKLTTFPPKRMKYLLTPEGLREKARLTREFVDFSLHFYGDARANARKIFQELAADGGGARVVFYGAEELAELTYLSLVESADRIELLGVVDEESTKEEFLSRPMLSLQQARTLSPDAVLVTRFGNVDIQALEERFGPGVKVVRVYGP